MSQSEDVLLRSPIASTTILVHVNEFPDLSRWGGVVALRELIDPEDSFPDLARKESGDGQTYSQTDRLTLHLDLDSSSEPDS